MVVWTVEEQSRLWVHRMERLREERIGMRGAVDWCDRSYMKGGADVERYIQRKLDKLWARVGFPFVSLGVLVGDILS